MSTWIAEEYSRRSALQKAMADEVLRLLQLQGTERVLDVGCGDGKITAEVAARLPDGSIVGVDVTPSMIEFASSHFAGALHPNLRFEVADARNLPFTEEFDLAISFNALHWIPDQHAALRSLHGALKPGAKAQLRLVADGERRSLENVLEETRQAPRWARYFVQFSDPYLHLTPRQYEEIAVRSGFRVASMHMASKAWDFESREAFFAFCLANCVKWTQQLPEAERPAFVNDMLERYRAVAADQPGEENTFKFYQLDIVLDRQSVSVL